MTMQPDLFAPSESRPSYPRQARSVMPAPSDSEPGRGGPRAHRHDPKPSHDAAIAARAFAETHAGIVLSGLRRLPLSTSAELARVMPFDLTETRRRLDDLKRSGRVRRIEPNSDSTPCAVSGKRVCRWEVRS